MFSQFADEAIFMPEPLIPGHYQLADARDACHADSFGGG
mgnify:CR=1 FL=1